MKKSIILIISLILSISWAQAFEKDGLYYAIIDGEAVVTNQSMHDTLKSIAYVFVPGMREAFSKYKGDIVIPPTVEYGGKTYKVTGISHYAFCFYLVDGITSITIPETIKRIGLSAFSRSSVKELVFPNSVEKIGNSACEDMLKLEKVVLPEKLDTIPQNMLGFGVGMSSGRNSALKEVVMPKSCKVIETEAFFYQNTIEELTLPEDLQEIKKGAFGLCKKLKMAFPLSLKYIGQKALSYTLSPTNDIDFENITLESSSFDCAKGLQSIKIPAKINNIPSSCFLGCSGVNTVEFTNQLDTIGEHAFDGLKQLKAIILPSSVEYIGRGAFARCPLLRSVYARMEYPPYLVDFEFGSLVGSNGYSPANPSDAVVYVPVGCKGNYERAGWGKYFAQIVEMEETEQKQEFDAIATGISTVKAGGDTKSAGWYDLQGRRLTEPRKGVNIIRYNDGTAKKVLK